MFRRFITAIAIVTAVLAPAGAAHADQADTDYGEYPCVMTFEGQSVTVGEPFGFTIECQGMSGASVAVQIAFAGEAAGAGGAVDVAGADSTQYALGADAAVSDTATVSAPGDYTVQVLGADGEPLSETYTITATAAGAGDGSGTDDGGLASTGSSSLPYLAIAGGLLLVGVGAIVVTRIRTTRHN